MDWAGWGVFGVAATAALTALLIGAQMPAGVRRRSGLREVARGRGRRAAAPRARAAEHVGGTGVPAGSPVLRTTWRTRTGRLTATEGMVSSVTGRLLPPTMLVRRVEAADGPVKCRYVAEWLAVKIRWGLTPDSTEKSVLDSYASTCSNTITVTYA